MAGFHIPHRIPGLRSVVATRPRRQEGVGAVDEEGTGEAVTETPGVADVVVSGIVVMGAGEADADAAGGVTMGKPFELKNGGAPRRATHVSRMKLGCIAVVAPARPDAV